MERFGAGKKKGTLYDDDFNLYANPTRWQREYPLSVSSDAR
jgi:hypothetical protein